MSVSVSEIYTASGFGAYYLEDILTLQKDPVAPHDRFYTKALSPHMEYVRESAEVLSIGLEIDDLGVVWGDCLGVSYGGKSGRESVFRAKHAATDVITIAQEKLLGTSFSSFRSACGEIARWQLPKAVEFGVSQALLQAFALKAKEPMAATLCREWELAYPNVAVPVHGSCGYDRYDNVDKMIHRRLASLPAGQGDDIPGQFGAAGEKLLEYVEWLKNRIRKMCDEEYRPTLHFDLHGAMSKVFANDLSKIVAYLDKLAARALPYSVRIESPVLSDTFEKQLQLYVSLKRQLNQQGVAVELVADEWANTLQDISLLAREGAVDMIHIKAPDLGLLCNIVESVNVCKKHGIKSLLGGSCVETDISTRVGTHIGFALQPTLLMAKPGMGVTEGIMMVHNEMSRLISLARTFQ